jgi:tetratricopeptide (TPR) repeat protein
MGTLAELFRVLDDWEDSEYAQSLELHPDSALEMARLAVARGAGLEEALEAVQAQIRVAAPALRGVLYDVIQVRQAEREITPDLLRRMLCDLHLAASRIQRERGSLEEASAQLVKAAACQSDNPYPELDFVELYVRMGKYWEAVIAVDSAVQDDQDAAFALFEVAVDITKKGAVAEAREAFERAQERDKIGLIADLCRLRLDGLGESGISAPSEEQLESSIDAASRALLARNAVQALDHLISVVAFVPSASRAWFGIGYVYSHGFDESFPIDRPNDEDGGSPPTSIIALYDVSANEKRYSELLRAAEAFRFSAHSDPNLAEASNQLAMCYLWLDRPTAALAPARHYASLRPDDPAAYSNLAMVLLASGDVSQAAHAVAFALERDPNDPVALFTLAKLRDLQLSGDLS